MGAFRSMLGFGVSAPPSAVDRNSRTDSVRTCNRQVTEAGAPFPDLLATPVNTSPGCTRIHASAVLYTGNCAEIGVPEGNRTPDPRFRKRGFNVLARFTAVQASSQGFARVHETG